MVSTMALDMVNKGVSDFHPCNQIRRLVSGSWVIRFNHTLRKGNECTDWLAKKGSSSDSSLIVWEQCPSCLTTNVLADTTGVARTRLR